MSDSNKTNKTIIKIVVSALAVVLVMLIIALIINLVRIGAVNDRKQSLAEQNAELARRIEESNSLEAYYSSDAFVEEYAREVLDMIYRGETVIGGK